MSFATIVEKFAEITMSIVKFDGLESDFISFFECVFESIGTASWFFNFMLLFFGEIVDPLHLNRKGNTFPG